MKRVLSLSVVFLLLVFAGCEEKIDLTDFEKGKGGNNNIGDTAYINISPYWTGFNAPEDIIVGHDGFIYVADTKNDRVVLLDLNGKVLGSTSIKNPIALAQDYQLNLLVCGQFDTTLSGVPTTVSAVFKLDMFASAHNIATAQIQRVLPIPGSGITKQDLRITYTGVTAFYDNRYYISRSGTENTSIVSPDNSILWIGKKTLNDGSKRDTLIGRLPNIAPLGTGVISANGISSIRALNRKNIDFLLTLTGENSFKSQWFNYVITAEGESYKSRFGTEDGTAFLSPDRFIRPEGINLDNAGNIFVADAGKDTVFKFSSRGDLLQKFGGVNNLKEPYAVAFFNRIVYVADKGNNRIARYILSTDVQ